MPKPDLVIRSRQDGRLELWFQGREGRVIDRVVKTRSHWWTRLVIMLEELVARRRATLILLPQGWEVWVRGNRERVKYE